MKYSLAFILLLGLLSPVLAQPQLSGTLSGTLGPGTYLVVGDITVPAGDSLSIAPGTDLLHNGHWYWMINGGFSAVGSASDSIRFVRQEASAAHRWAGLRFQSGASPATLSYCVIDNACITTYAPVLQYGGGIFSHGVPLTVTHCTITHCDAYWGGGGLYADNVPNLVIEDCSISENAGIQGSNGGGILLNHCSNAWVAHNTISANLATGG